MSRVRPYGQAALLVETDAPLALWRAAARLPGVVEAVPAARTVLLRFDPAVTGEGALTAAVAHLDLAHTPSPPAPTVELEVRYDGADLDVVADETGLSRDEVIGRHAAAAYVVAFGGFTPGFAYLTGLDPALRLPRLASPRTSVPAGSVAIADDYTGIYPRSSPGGWRLLGTTDADLWDAVRAEPALLRPGMRVRFHPA